MLINDYSLASNDEAAEDLIMIWYWERMSDSPYLRLAFSSELARSLGWQPSSDKPFGWNNKSGELMVWSVFWRDGLFDGVPPKFHNEVDEGMTVVGTPQVLEEVKNHFRMPLNQKIRVEQQWRVDSENHQTLVVLEREISENQLARQGGS